MNKSLVTIISETANIEQMLVESGGEMTPDIESFLQINASELSLKVDGYSTILDRFEMLESFYEQQAEFYNKVAVQCENAAKRLKLNLIYAMNELGQSEIKGSEIRFKLTNSAGSLVINDPEMVPVEFKTEVITTEIKKDEVKAALKRGEKVEGAELKIAQSIRVFPNLPDKKQKTKEVTNG